MNGVRYAMSHLHLCIGCAYCIDDDPDEACACPCHEEDEEAARG